MRHNLTKVHFGVYEGGAWTGALHDGLIVQQDLARLHRLVVLRYTHQPMGSVAASFRPRQRLGHPLRALLRNSQGNKYVPPQPDPLSM